METWIAYAVAGLVALMSAYYAVKAILKKMGDTIPGEDPFEKAADFLEEKVDPIVVKIDALVPGETPGAADSSDA